MKRAFVWLVLAAGSVEVLLRFRFPRLTWLLTTAPRDRRALMSELQRLDSDPEFRSAFHESVGTEWQRRQINRAFGELVRALEREGGPI